MPDTGGRNATAMPLDTSEERLLGSLAPRTVVLGYWGPKPGNADSQPEIITPRRHPLQLAEILVFSLATASPCELRPSQPPWRGYAVTLLARIIPEVRSTGFQPVAEELKL